MKPILLIAFISLVVCGCNNRQSQANQTAGNYAADTLKKKTVQREVLSFVNYNQVFENKIVDETPINLLEIGDLKVPTGKIVACDPLVTINFTPFNKSLNLEYIPLRFMLPKRRRPETVMQLQN